jgi:hypothetical protein
MQFVLKAFVKDHTVSPERKAIPLGGE